MKVYISGPITGTTDYMERFSHAEKYLNEGGSTVINPAKVNSNLPDDTTHEDYMRVSLALIDISDCMYVLENWQHSKGCALEIAYAKEKNMPIFYQREQEIMNMIENLACCICDSICNHDDSEESEYGYYMKKCDSCKIVSMMNGIEKYIKDIDSQLTLYRMTGIKPSDMKIIDEKYRKMARKLYEQGV